MADKVPAAKGITPDWLVRGVLTKIGDIFDRLTGRGWKPSSSLATSELIGKLKTLLDAEAREDKPGCMFVPNNIKLKMQWDKFSTDSDEGLRKLEAEMLAAVVDHINDKRYFTHAPLSLEVKPDYFTEGVRLLVSFDRFSDDDNEAGVNLMPGKTSEAADPEEAAPKEIDYPFEATYSINGVERSRTLTFRNGTRRSVGRTKENDLSIEDPSVSKIHASLTANGGQLVVGDTGSTNGTFVNGERIAYGKTAPVGDGENVTFGTVNVRFKSVNIPRPSESLATEKTEAFQPRELEFTARMETIAPIDGTNKMGPNAANEPMVPAPTEPSIPDVTLPSIDIEKKD